VSILQFGVLGLATGAIYALLAQGLVLVYRGSGLLNFSQGALAMAGAYFYYELVVPLGLSKWLGLVLALVASGLLGAVIQLLVLNPMRRASALSRVIATLGVLLILQSAAYLRYGPYQLAVPSLIPTTSVHLGSAQLAVGLNRLGALVIGVVLTIVLFAVYKYSSFGRATAAVAHNPAVAASLGYSANFIAAVNWALGSALAGLAGILIAPIIFLDPTSIVLLVLPAMSAALLGQFASFPITLVVALVLGGAQSEITQYVGQPGWATAVPFVVVLIVMMARGTSLPLRSYLANRLPAVGTGRIRVIPVVICYTVIAWLALASSPDWATALTSTCAFAIIALSIVVITGYCGQLSLAQSVIAGIGALIAARMAAYMPFIVALIAATIVTAILSALVASPALRTRGTVLAILTLGLGEAVADIVFGNNNYSGGSSGITVPVPNLFGWNIDPFSFGNRYAFVTFTILALLALTVANLRRGAMGRRLLAVRSNERAAAAVGISNARIKIYAFCLGGAIASIGGIMLAFSQSLVSVSQVNEFMVIGCIVMVANVVAGGVGSIGGAFIGALMVSGGLITQLFQNIPSVAYWLPLIGGVSLVLTLIAAPDGLFDLNRELLMRLVSPLGRLGARLPQLRRAKPADPGAQEPPALRVRGLPLKISGLSVAYGGITALHDINIDIEPGEIHGLIGPNGAGKTTLIDAITGFTRPYSGKLWIGTKEMTGHSPQGRARDGIARSFQSLELFTDLTVAENLVVAEEKVGVWHGLTDLVAPRRAKVSAVAQQVLREFDLLEYANAKPDTISFGHRKLVAIARALVTMPSVLLLDEPAAGLGDREADHLAGLIRKVAKEWGMGVLLVEHKVDIVMALSDRVTVLNNGEVLVSGPPDEVRTNPEVLDAYLGTRDAVY
jgi:ABC-type branched-subunit amino acid transport system ATPase component/branched-subunit amino acid ABC-type transport system permease component